VNPNAVQKRTEALLKHLDATTLRLFGQFDEAADYAERAYTKALRVGDHEVIVYGLYARALIYIEQHDFNHAAAMLKELEPMLPRTVPPDEYWLGAVASAQALLTSGKGDFKTALPLADHAVTLAECASKAGRAGGEFLPVALIRRSTIELDAAEPSQAAADVQRAVSLLKAKSAPGALSSIIGQAYLNLGRALRAQEKHEDAGAAFRSAVENLQSTVGSNHPDTRSARHPGTVRSPTPLISLDWRSLRVVFRKPFPIFQLQRIGRVSTLRASVLAAPPVSTICKERFLR